VSTNVTMKNKLLYRLHNVAVKCGRVKKYNILENRPAFQVSQDAFCGTTGGAGFYESCLNSSGSSAISTASTFTGCRVAPVVLVRIWLNAVLLSLEISIPDFLLIRSMMLHRGRLSPWSSRITEEKSSLILFRKASSAH